MKLARYATLALVLLGSVSLSGHASAQVLTAVTEWNFNNNAVAVNISPASSTGTGTASTVGMNIDSATGTVDGTTTDTSDINTSTPLSSDPGTGGVNTQWRIRGGNGTTSPGTNPVGTNAWTSLAPIGSQGAQFLTSTAGFNGIQVSFDWSPTTQGENKLQLQYTLNGTTYTNVPASMFTGTAVALTMTNTASANTVMGGYLQATSSTAYMNGITANLSTIAGAANDKNFGIRLVSAATGTDDTSVAGTALNNTSGNWRFDEVTISGTAIASGVPEPGTFVWVAAGFAGLLALMRRRFEAV